MSSAVSAEDVGQNFIAVSCIVSMTALLVYEYLITFDREYQLVWKRRFSVATLFFLLARYTVLFQLILNLPSIYPLSLKSCVATAWLITALEIVIILLSAAFASLRVYALSGRQWHLASLIFVLSAVRVGTNLYNDVHQVAIVTPPPINCTTLVLTSPELANTSMYVLPSDVYYSAHGTFPVTYVERLAVIVADILVLVVTVYRTYWTRRTANEANLQTPLHSLILRDGTLYFATLLIMNIVDIVSTYLGETMDSMTYTNQFIDPITAILISRFILNLREIDPSEHSSEDPASRTSFARSIRFAAFNFVDPLGAPLDHEVSFSAIDLTCLDPRDVSGESGHSDVLSNDEEAMSSHATLHESIHEIGI